MPRPFPSDPFYCATQAVADVAGELSCAARLDGLSLADGDACRSALQRAGINLTGLPEDTYACGLHVALRMVEDRARRATAFREPRR